MPSWLVKLLAFIITLAVPIVLILANIFLFATPEWLAFQYSQPDFPPSVRFTPPERYQFASESIEYIRGNRTLGQFRALGVYEEREIKHMVDVRELVDKVKIVLPVMALLAIMALILLSFPSFLGRGQGRVENDAMLTPTPILPLRGGGSAIAARALVNGAMLTIGLFVFVGIFAGIGFNTFFTLFHRIFFSGDSWLFNYTDSLIQFYPLPFWFATSITLVVLTILEAVAVGAIGWWWGRSVGRTQ